MKFFPQSFQVKDLSTRVQLLCGKAQNELYQWPRAVPQVNTASLPSAKATLSSWHSRLGHPSTSILNTVVSSFSLPVSLPSQKLLSCNDCFINKTHKLPFHQSTITSIRPLQYLYSDVWSSPILSSENHKYYLVIIDHFTRYTWFFPLKQKSEVKETVIVFKNLIENFLQAKIGTFYSDNGGEFIALRQYFQMNGISHLTSPPHTPEHNGIAERKHRHVVETGLTLLSKASIPKKYWQYAFAVAVYLINRLPTPLLELQSPFSKLFGKSPNYNKLRVFGCACYPWLRPYTRHKLEDRSARCVFFGYSPTQSAYLCYDIDNNRMYCSRHVQFDEFTFPFSDSDTQSTRSPTTDTDTEPVYTPTSTALPLRPSSQVPHPGVSSPTQTPATTTTNAPVSPSNFQTPSASPSSEPTAPTQKGPTPTAQTDQAHQTISTHAPIIPQSNPNPDASHIQNENQQTNPNQTQTVPPANPTTEISNQQPSPNQTEITTSQSTSSSSSLQPPPQPEITNSHPMSTRAKKGITKPNSKYLYAINLTDNIEPRTIIQAIKDEKWRKSATAEFNAQLNNHTWDLVPKPKGDVTIVGCRWIFTIKYNPDGTIKCHKGRLVAKGYNQLPGLDYSKTFSPVIKSTTIRIVLGVAVDQNWPIRQLDVNNAFLQGTLSDEVYMSQPPGFVDPTRPHHVCRLRKALYGLKQAPRAWYDELRSFLISIGFTNSVSDTSLFILKKDRSLVYILVYVDDILVTGNDNFIIQQTLTALAQRFSVKDHEELHYFLGIEAKRGPQGLHLSQKRYILDLLERTNMLGAKPVATPMATSPKLTLHSGSSLTDPTEYRRIVGSLQYLAFTRPDLSYTVIKLSQYMHSPTSDHWNAVKRALRYLAGTVDYGICLRRGNSVSLHAFSDVDWAGDGDDYVSTNGYVVYIGHHPVSWSSKKQKSIARSSTEAEYRSVANTSSELIWITSLLHELGIPLTGTPTIYCDNLGATYLCANPVFHSRMKHVALDYHSSGIKFDQVPYVWFMSLQKINWQTL